MIRVKVKKLMEEKGINATELMRGANISYGTALRLKHNNMQGIRWDVLEALCKYFECEVEDILEYSR